MPQGKVRSANATSAKLPEISHKFSSWDKQDQNLNELDELLMEHDLINESPSAAKAQPRKGLLPVGRNRDHSPDQFDLEEVIDEFGDSSIEAGGVDLEEFRAKNASASKQQITDESNSFDLDNSDDLNRFIQKYETMLESEGYAGKKANTNSGSKLATLAQAKKSLARDRSRDLEDSWGSLQLQAEQMLAGGGEIEDETTDKTKTPKNASGGLNVSISTTMAAAQHKIEEEIINEELRLAQQNKTPKEAAKRGF